MSGRLADGAGFVGWKTLTKIDYPRTLLSGTNRQDRVAEVERLGNAFGAANLRGSDLIGSAPPADVLALPRRLLLTGGLPTVTVKHKRPLAYSVSRCL